MAGDSAHPDPTPTAAIHRCRRGLHNRRPRAEQLSLFDAGDDANSVSSFAAQLLDRIRPFTTLMLIPSFEAFQT